MKKRVSVTWHFDQEEAGDNHLYRELEAQIGMLGGIEAIAAERPEHGRAEMFSALNALFQGFTLEQFTVACLGILVAFEERIGRHTRHGNDYSVQVVKQTVANRMRFKTLCGEFLDSISYAQVQERTGFEKFRRPT